jgi:hypothetical protein
MNIDLRNMLIRRVSSVAVIVASTALGACATVIHGTHQEVGIASTPTGASVTIDGNPHGQTPVVASLSRKSSHVIRVELAGFKPYETTVTRSVSGWVWGNLVIGGLIGLGVDAISGGLYKLSPEQVNSALEYGRASVVPGGDGVYVAGVREPQPGWQRVGQLARD